MATIHDVARKAGVSVATVSRYFNHGYVGAKSRLQIELAIKNLDYHIDAVARALNKKSSRTIGLIIPSITNPFFPELAQAVENKATAHNYKLVLCNTGNSIRKEAEFINMLAANYADGIITATGNCSEIYKELNFPVVSIDRKLEGDFIHVDSDNSEGGRIAVRHLYECGCRNILFIRQKSDTASLMDRQSGFIDEAGRLKIKYDIYKFVQDDINEVLDKNHKMLIKYDGIFAWNDITAIRVLHTCCKHNIQVPGELMLIGYDNIYMSRMIIPMLTTISQNIYGMGEAGIGILLDLIEGKTPLPEATTLNVELLKRETTKLYINNEI